jgi:hypothetical protein
VCGGGTVHKAGNGKQTMFWLVVWLDDVPQKLNYHELFQIRSDLQVMVGATQERGGWMIHFRRELNEHLRIQWEELYGRLLGHGKMECFLGWSTQPYPSSKLKGGTYFFYYLKKVGWSTGE